MGMLPVVLFAFSHQRSEWCGIAPRASPPISPLSPSTLIGIGRSAREFVNDSSRLASRDRHDHAANADAAATPPSHRHNSLRSPHAPPRCRRTRIAKIRRIELHGSHIIRPVGVLHSLSRLPAFLFRHRQHDIRWDFVCHGGRDRAHDPFLMLGRNVTHHCARSLLYDLFI